MAKLITAAIDFFYFPVFKKYIPLKTFRYIACGGGNLILDIFLYFIVFNFILQKQNLNLHYIVLSSPIAALFIVFPITFITGFLLSKHITFGESNLKSKIQVFRYSIVTFGAICINYFFMKFFVEYLAFYPTISKILITIISVIYSYTLQNRFTFK